MWAIMVVRMNDPKINDYDIFCDSCGSEEICDHEYGRGKDLGKDDNGKYVICNGCNQRIYECDHVLPLEDWCSKCMYGEEE